MNLSQQVNSTTGGASPALPSAGGLQKLDLAGAAAAVASGTNETEPLMFEHVETINTIADVGYLLSLLTLIFALIILTCIKRLRSPKNNIHLQLFISFIIRCVAHLLKQSMKPVMGQDNSEQNSWACKLVVVLWQYSLMANYNWILMEGVYLYSLIFFITISPYGPSIISYTIFGWTIPLIFIIPWTLVKAKYEDESCWLLNSYEGYFWILRAPVTLSILINVFIYIRIVLVVYSKLFSDNMTLQISMKASQSNYRRLLRSTLVLIPLFGVHYAVLLILQQAGKISDHELTEVIWLYIETIFSSCQGCIVACLYCFLNDEVHQEVKRLWIKWFK